MDFEEYFIRIRKKRIVDRTICFDPANNTLSELIFVLKCFGLCASGSKNMLITRLLAEGFRTGDEFIFGLEKFWEKLCQKDCPIYMIRVFLGSKGESPWGDKKDLAERIRKYFSKYIPGKISTDFDFMRRTHLMKREQSREEDEIADVISLCLRNNNKIKNLTKSQEDTLLEYGYSYSHSLETLVHLESREKISGEKLVMSEFMLLKYADHLYCSETEFWEKN